MKLVEPFIRMAIRSTFALVAFCVTAAQSPAAAPARSEPIPMDQIGAVAGKQYQGDGLSVTATPEGARLRCVFQKLEGEATREGLWLTSTVTNTMNERFRVKAVAVGRQQSSIGSDGCIGGMPKEDQAQLALQRLFE